MKEFIYKWDEKIYLLHTEYNRIKSEITVKNYSIHQMRMNEEGSVLKEEERIIEEDSFRIIVSRINTDERWLRITYPDDIKLTVFEIDDRAYYPTKSFYEG